MRTVSNISSIAFNVVDHYFRDRFKIATRKKRWDEFLIEQRSKAQKRKPRRVKDAKKMKGTLYAIRNNRIAIREGALRKVAVIIGYNKVTTGEFKLYEVLPLSYRYKKLKDGFRKVLYAYDKNDPSNKRQLKNFVLRNIKNVSLTDRKWRPNKKYPIEIK